MSARERIAGSTFGKFLVVGGVSYGINQAALVFLYEAGFAWLPRGRFDAALLAASIVALEVSIIVRFVLNDRWTFRRRCHASLGRRLYQSNVSSFGGPLIALAAVNLLTPRLGISYLITNSMGILAGLAWNWFWSDLIVWKRDAGEPAEAAPETPGLLRV